MGIGLGLGACSEERETRPLEAPNILLITLDSVRADVLGAYGHRSRFRDASPSPRIDQLAREGLLIEQAHATSSWTLPSHVSIFTGHPELVHGVEQDGHEIHASLPLISETLKAEGYRTAGFYSGPYLDPAFGFGRGFDTYEARYGDDLRFAMEDLRRSQAALDEAEKRGKKGELYTALASHARAQQAVETASHRDRSSELVADALIEELNKPARGRPFFLFGHFFDPHYDYAPPEEFARTFDPDYSGDLDATDFIRNPAISHIRPGGRTRVVDERGLQHLWALYEAEVAWTDSQIGRVLDRLEKLGLAEDTLVIITSDHGDEFFEHGSIGHRSTLYEELVRVPLIVRYPRAFPPGSRIEQPLSSIEIAPTILLAAGTRVSGLSGVGLQAILGGRSPGPVFGRIVTTQETPLAVVDPPLSGARTRVLESFRKGRIKIFREISWIQPTEKTSDKLTIVIDDLRLDMLANEALNWTLLDASPDEKKLWQEFEHEEEAQALEDFRRAYQTFLGQRRSPGRVAVTGDVLSALSGLGYVEQEARIGALEGDDLVLYPPKLPPEEIRLRKSKIAPDVPPY
jgi:arylsulfatase A-like enzyme